MRVFVILLSLVIVALILSIFVFKDALLFALVVTLPLIYLVIVLRDLKVIEQLLSALLKISSEELDSSKKNQAMLHKFGTLYTDFAKSLLHNIEALRTRISALAWQAQAQNKALNINNSQLINENNSQSDFYANVLKVSVGSFKSDAAAIIVFDQANFDNSKIYTYDIEGNKFLSQLKRFFNDIPTHGGANCIGVQDSFNGNNLTTNFSAFGLRYTIAYPFGIDLQKKTCSGAVWFGYRADNIPTELEQRWAQDLVYKIDEEMHASRVVHKLSDKVTKAEQLNKEKTEFMLHISHDIRSPLNNIKSILNLIKLEGIKSDTPELIEVALRNCDSVGYMVEDILDYSRFRAGRLLSLPESVLLNDCILDVLEEFKIAARLKGLSLNFSATESERVVLADRRHVRRIVTNLISNAIKYTKKGGITISIFAEDTSNWCLEVKDTGIGMNKEQLEKVFTPFTRFSPGHGDGIGLGLTLTKILIELNGGTVQIDSAEGRGSSFRVTFRADSELESANPGRQLQVDQNAKTVVPKVFNDTSSNTQIRVLIVDDDVDCVDSLARNLERLEYRVYRAYTVTDALSILNFENCEVLISDATMPDGGGKRLLDFLKVQNKSTQSLILSGQSDNNEFLNFGASKVISKPADVQQIDQWIRSLNLDPASIDEISTNATFG